MGFLIRSAFWLSLVLLFLPIGVEDTQETGGEVGAFQAIAAARDAIGDLSSLCERQPDVCETGRAAIHTIGVRARETARIALELLDEGKAGPDEDIKTGTVAPVE